MGTLNQKLGTQSVKKSFFQYFLPTIFGMMLMSVNIVIDGIFVGHGIGSVALASVNIAAPVFSIIISVALLIGIGGATLYSMSMGEKEPEKAKQYFSLAILLTVIISVVITVIGYFNVEAIARFFGANDETLGYAIDYMSVLFIGSMIVAFETVLSIFVRNDGAPNLAMTGLIVSAVINILLNYWMIFILEWEVIGTALATTIATALGALVYILHFFNKNSGLKFIRPRKVWKQVKTISAIGFPNFLSEAGIGIFVIGYNVAMAYYIGTSGLAAFSVINYLHTFMFLAFIGIGTTIQPMISYYYGAKRYDSITDTVKLAEKTGLVLGIIFTLIGFFGADLLVAIFGVESKEIFEMATSGLKLFFLGYLFMGINFIYMTYYQSIGRVKPSIIITVARGFIILIVMLLILPYFFGINGIWLALPVTEAIVAVILVLFVRKGVIEQRRMVLPR